MNLRSGNGNDDEYIWPEAGPSSLPQDGVSGDKGGRYGAKAAAAMSGAVVTSLLSMSLHFLIILTSSIDF